MRSTASYPKTKPSSWARQCSGQGSASRLDAEENCRLFAKGNRASLIAYLPACWLAVRLVLGPTSSTTCPDPHPHTSPTTGRSVGLAAGERLLHLRQTILRSPAVWRLGLHAQTEAREPPHLPLISPFVYIKTIMRNVQQHLHTPQCISSRALHATGEPVLPTAEANTVPGLCYAAAGLGGDPPVLLIDFAVVPHPPPSWPRLSRHECFWSRRCSGMRGRRGEGASLRGVRLFQGLAWAVLRRTLPATRGEGGLLSALTHSWTNNPCTPRRDGSQFLHPLPRLENKSLMACPSSLSSPAFVGHCDVPLLLEVSACPSRHEDDVPAPCVSGGAVKALDQRSKGQARLQQVSDGSRTRTMSALLLQGHAQC